MKSRKYNLLIIMLLMAVSIDCQAKNIKVGHLYMFGLSASFRDSTVYITDIHDIQGAWIDSKTKFLLYRENYSEQLNEYLSQKLQRPGRVCIVFYSTNMKGAEKELQKIKKIYGYTSSQAYDTQHITAQDFKFEAVEIPKEEE